MVFEVVGGPFLAFPPLTACQRWFEGSNQRGSSISLCNRLLRMERTKVRSTLGNRRKVPSCSIVGVSSSETRRVRDHRFVGLQNLSQLSCALRSLGLAFALQAIGMQVQNQSPKSLGHLLHRRPWLQAQHRERACERMLLREWRRFLALLLACLLRRRGSWALGGGGGGASIATNDEESHDNARAARTVAATVVDKSLQSPAKQPLLLADLDLHGHFLAHRENPALDKGSSVEGIDLDLLRSRNALLELHA